MSKKEAHRPGPFKQINKPHKIEQGKSKRRLKGKTDVKAQSIRRKHLLSKEERKNQLNQIRKAKKEEVLKMKRRVGLAQTPPIAVMIMALDDAINAEEFLDEIKSCDDELEVKYSSLGNCHISSSRLKQRFTFVVPRKTDIHSIMDAAKVSEILLLLHSTEVPDQYTEMLLSVLIAHALPTTIHAVLGLDKLNPKKKADCKKHLLKNIETKFPEAKLHQSDTKQELQLLLRQIGSQKQRPITFRDARFHMLAEDAELINVDMVSGKGTLKVSGYIRGQPLNVNSLVHIPGWGTFQMSQVTSFADPFESEKKKKNLQWSITEEPDQLKQESLQSEVEPDPMEGEQTWPTQEELAAAEMQPKRTVKKVAEGTSEYQASWIIESENEDSENSGDESDMEDAEPNESFENCELENTDMDQDMGDTESIASMKDENYDKNMDLDEEKKMLVRFKEERENEMFPDEQDTPIDVSARIRYQRYRGLKSFNTSPWDPMENLPHDYAKIYRFEHFRQTKKKVLNSEKEGLWSETYATLFIKDVPQSLYEAFEKDHSILIVYGLLPHEQKMSVINTVIRKHPSCKSSIKSKDELIFHIGFTRFTCKPIFSEHKTGNKFKYERYLPPEGAVVASFYAPVLFPQASVTVFRQRKDGSLELVATGNMLNVDPNRIVVKRVVLSGHPFKIFKRSAVVRYMFFNKDDINWFKCVELYTKCGRRGHIRESLGSHGHMKCVFDQQLQSHDVVLMSLYKRVFPKWTYQVYNSNEENLNVDSESMTTENICDT
ncbi:pre-rRNA-processing protein TSR1 homolog [Parasteatoda tepidariorum]|uniref:pre-rRNA-processing protein TSR1 homolog n=1 Tax=Parasteatoda tepidariorum TaxID=114398 RepID=UPI001C717E59|nr:pre-rRNA-processing protein TSR1 homolog [Parasteatoda tepidariorum]